MANTRVTQLFVENLRARAAVVKQNTRVTQEYVENMRARAAVVLPAIRVTRQHSEVLRATMAVVRVTHAFVEQIVAVDATKKARFTQFYADQIITGNFNPKPRVSQVWADVVESFEPTPKPRVTQVWVDVIRSVAATIEAEVPSANLTLTTSAPEAGQPQSISVPSGNLTFSTFTPDLALVLSLEIPAGNLTLFTFAPEVAVPVEIAVPSGNLVLSTFVPIKGTVSVEVSSGDLTLTTSVPIVSVEAVPVDTGIEIPSTNLALSTTLSAPEVVYARLISVPSANLTLTKFAPLATTNDNLKVVPSANLHLTTSQVVRQYSEISIPSANLTLTTSVVIPTLSERIVPSTNLTLSASAPHVRVLVPYQPTTGTVLKMIVLTAASGELELPPDWNPNAHWIWPWGAGGRGAHASEVGIFIASGGGGGGGFQQYRNIGGAPGDVWTYAVGQHNLGRTLANRTMIWDANDSLIVAVHSGDNGNPDGFGTGGLGGGGGPSQAGSNRGGWGGRAGGGGGGGGSAGPISGQGTYGGFGANGGGEFAGTGVGAGGGGGGAVGDFENGADGASIARGGFEPAVVGGQTGLVIALSGAGGPGYYGEGAGLPVGGGSYYPDDEGAGPEGLVGNPGLENTGGASSGGAAGINWNELTFFTQDGGDGASWTFIQSLPTNRWMLAPFTWSVSISGRFAELSNGTVPGGAGGGGGSGFGTLLAGGAFGGNGGKGGFPGGGGGGAGYDSEGIVSIAFGQPPRPGSNDALGGDGADGLILIFYEGVPGEVCLPCDEDLSPCGNDEEPEVDGEWPFDLLQPRHVGIHMVPATLGGGPLYGGLEGVTTTQGGFWRFSFGAVYLRTSEQRRAWRKLEALADGRGGVLRLHIYDGKRAPWATIPGAEDMDIRAETDFAVGAESGRIRANFAGVIQGGMHFSYQDRLYRIITADEPVASVYNVTIWPPVRKLIPNGQPLEFRRPTCRVRLMTDEEMQLKLDVLKHANPDVDFEEDK